MRIAYLIHHPIRSGSHSDVECKCELQAQYCDKEEEEEAGEEKKKQNQTVAVERFEYTEPQKIFHSPADLSSPFSLSNQFVKFFF